VQPALPGLSDLLPKTRKTCEKKEFPIKSTYTTTITDEAIRRGIEVEVIDAETPIFTLKYGGKKIRCYNSLTDNVGAVTFYLTQDKYLANSFLKAHGFPVPEQILYTTFRKAAEFLERRKPLVVKPRTQWGARGVSTHISTEKDLHYALGRASRFEKGIVLEECITGVDRRLIFVDHCFASAIQRTPPFLAGDGKNSVRNQIIRRNRERRRTDPANIIPLDRETVRCLGAQNLTLDSVPKQGQKFQARWTTNFHTGGTVDIISDSVGQELKDTAEEISRLAGLPLLGVDFLLDETDKSYRIVELAPDVAISPRGGRVVAKLYIDYLFPETSSH
jgi:D-alanine-D-alanine ligase-like ATP-grasp enzyme